MTRHHPMQPTFIRKQSGFSLIELMIALVLSLFLIGVSVFVLSTNSVTFRRNTDKIEIQDNARFSMDVLIEDLGMTGYYGCGRKIVNNLVPQPAGHLLDTTFPIDGFEQDTGVWAAQGNNDLAAMILPGTDAITIRKVRQKGVPIRANMVLAGDPVLASNVGFGAGTLAVIYDCEATNLFQATAVSNTTVFHAAGGAFFPGNVSDTFFTDDSLSEQLPYQQTQYYLSDPAADLNGVRAKTYVAPFDAFRYFVARDIDGNPGLWREYYNPIDNAVVQQELIPGVENMQILYHVEPPNGNPATYVTADQVTVAGGADGWTFVTAIKVTLLVRSVNEVAADVNAQTYDINSTPDNAADDVGPFNDRRRREIVSTTILMRNRQLDLGSINS